MGQKNSRYQDYEFRVKDGDTWIIKQCHYMKERATIVLKFTNNYGGGSLKLIEIGREQVVELIAGLSKTLVAMTRYEEQQMQEAQRLFGTLGEHTETDA
jgi:hypothetical protein